MFKHLTYEDDNDDNVYGTVRTDRFTSAPQVNTHFRKHKTLIYLPDDIGGAVSKRNYQSSGALDSVISKIKTINKGDIFSFVGEDGKKYVIENPSIGIYANLKESDFYHFAKTSDSGFLTLFITNVVKNNEFKVNKSKRRSQITNECHANFIEHCNSILSPKKNPYNKKSAAVLDFAYDPIHYYADFTGIVDHHGVNEYRSYISGYYDSFKKLAGVIAFWNGSDGIISREIMEACAKYCCYRLKVLIEELEVKKSDDITGDSRTRVLDTIYKSGESGLSEARLIQCCALYRKLAIDDRIALINALIMDKQIEERINDGKGRHGKRFYYVVHK
jgi:hypothetical protein